MAELDNILDDVFGDFFKEQKEKTDYIQDVKDGKFPFDNKNPLAIDNIMNAAKRGDANGLQELKTLGADFDVQDKDGNTALMNAIISRQMFENPKSVVFLLQNTMDFRLQNKNGENVAMVALENHCQDKLVQSLIEKTDNIYAESHSNINILTAALSHDDLSMETVGLILAKATGKDKNEVTKGIKANYSGHSPWEEDIYKAQLLILAGADPTKYFGKNSTAVIKAQFNIMQHQAQQIKEQQQQISQLQQHNDKQEKIAPSFNAILSKNNMRR